MSEIFIMRGRYLLTDPRKKEKGVLKNGAIAIEGDRIAAVGTFEELQRAHRGAKVLGNGRQFLMPGLVDAHSHGRGMSPIQKGVKNDFLENTLFDWAYMHLLPPELCASMLAWLRSGWGPTKRPGTPADIGGAVAALCSEDAQWITGQTIAADGGASLMNPELPLDLQRP